MTTIRYTLATEENAPAWLYPTYDSGTSTYYFKYHDGLPAVLIPSVISSAGSGPSPIFDTPLINPTQLDTIFNQWSSVIDVNFSTSAGEKHVYIGAVQPNNPGWTISAATLTARGVMDGQDLTGQYALVFNYGQNTIDVKNFTLGTWGGWVAMHELGHVLGLKHSAENPIPTVNDFRMSIMDYPINNNGTPSSTIKIPLTPGMQDIADLQNGNADKGITAYGESQTSSDNDNYTFVQTGTGASATGSIKLGSADIVNNAPIKHVMTIWDSGGKDTLDASRVDSSVFIDLRAGHFSSIGSGINHEADASSADINNDGFKDGTTDWNVGIALNAMIENAKGGSKHDTIIGNIEANTLEGGKGNDILKGEGGNDRYLFNVGDGTDTITDADGSIWFGTTQLPTGVQVKNALDTWESLDHKVRYIKTPQDNGKFTLTIIFTESTTDKIIVKDWVDGQLGIVLEAGTTDEAPTLTNISDMYFVKDEGERIKAGDGGDIILVTEQVDTMIMGGDGDDLILGYGYPGPITLSDNHTRNVVLNPNSGTDHTSSSWSSLANRNWQLDTSVDPTSVVYMYGAYLGASFILSGTHTEFGNVSSDTLYTYSFASPSDTDTQNFIMETIYGDAGNDLISGSVDADFIDGGDDNDILAGGSGNDYIFGQNGVDQLIGDDGDDVLDGGDGADFIFGGYGSDYLQGGAGNDQLAGDLPAIVGSDAPPVSALFHLMGNDTLYGGEGDDILVGGAGENILYGGEGDDSLRGAGIGTPSEFQGNNYLDGGDGSDVIYGGEKNDTLIGGEGDDWLYGGGGDDILMGGIGSDTLSGEMGADTYYVGNNDRITGQDSQDTIKFLSGENAESASLGWNPENGPEVTVNLGGFTITLASGVVANDDATLTFADGSQIRQSELLGTKLNAVVYVSSLNGALFGGTLNDTLITNSTSGSKLFGGLGNDTLNGGIGNDVLNGGDGIDMMSGGLGDDTYYVDINESNNNLGYLYENTNEGIDTVISSVTYRLDQHFENLTLTSNGVTDGFGNALNNRIVGNAFYNSLYGEGGNDVLEGGAGNDFLDGGNGADIYSFNKGFGHDQIQNFDTDTLGTAPDKIVLGDDILMSDVILHRDANDLIVFVNGSVESIVVGNHFGQAASAIDAIQFANGTVWDTTLIDQKIQGPKVFIGSSQNDEIMGYSSNETLLGLAGNDYLSGGAGNDTLDGGAGDDYLIDSYGDDVFIFGRGYGQDTVRYNDIGEDLETNADIIQFAEGVTIGDLVVRVPTDSTGNLLINILGTNDTITIEKFFYVDPFSGFYEPLVGSPTIRLFDGTLLNSQDMLSASLIGGSGSDTLKGYLTDDTIMGNAGDDIIDGSYGNDLINGGAGNDLIDGGYGDDTYQFGIGSGQDIIDINFEVYDLQGILAGYDKILLGAGLNTSNVTISWIPIARNTYNFDLTITINGTSDSIVVKNFWYYTDIEDGVTKLRADGNGPVIQFENGVIWDHAYIYQYASRPMYFSPNGPTVSNDDLLGTEGSDIIHALSGDDYVWSEGGDDQLFGEEGNDILNGGAGADILIGGSGNDTYVVDNLADQVIETSTLSTEIDEVWLLSDYTLTANVENLKIIGTVAVNGTGNGLNNTLTGNEANNILNGGAGSDTMVGGLGNDTYIVDVLTDVITENLNQGTDTVNVAIATPSGTYTLANNVENATLTNAVAYNLTGNTLNNVLIGNALSNHLNGGTGNDTMIGGAGNDTYTINVTSDIITENLNEGTDLVNVAIATASGTYTLAANVENATLTNTVAYTLTGNALDNILTGNAAANTLNGGDGNDTLNGLAGNDTMVGGLGNDSYTTDATGDVITEAANAGMDTVNVARTTSGATYTIAANVENAFLINTVAYNLTGNALANYMRGNAANNTLRDTTGGNDLYQGFAGIDTLNDTVGNNVFDGGVGNDIITAGSGRDLLIGGTGNDTITTGTGYDVISFNKGDGQDTINASTGADNTISLGGNFAYSDLSLSKSGNNLIVKMGTTDQMTLKDWYLSTTNRSVVNLQVIAEAIQGFSLGGSDALRNNKVERFNFTSLVAAFDAAGATANWQLTDARLTAHLQTGSDTTAIGGDLAYQYGKNSNLTGMGLLNAQGVINNASFGQTAQTLNNPSVWQAELVKLG